MEELLPISLYYPLHNQTQCLPSCNMKVLISFSCATKMPQGGLGCLDFVPTGHKIPLRAPTCGRNKCGSLPLLFA